MDIHADPDPVEAFVEGLKTTERLRGVPLYDSAADLTNQSSPNRIVIFLDTGDLAVRAKSSAAQIDADLRCVARIWGESGRHAWALLRRLLWGWREWTRATAAAPLVEWTGLEGDTDPDTNKQGVSLSVRFTLKSQPIADVIDPTTGLVQTVSLMRG